jgi:AMP-polyphosphate phosphotransferase
MFEAATLGRTVAPHEYDTEVSRLRWQLLDAQRSLRHARFPALILFGGVDGAGKSETVHLLNEWMDPRWMINRAFDEPSQDELERPRFWRYWLTVPPRGSMGLFLSAWYSAPLMDRVMRRTSRAEFDEALDQIVSFERTLADDGALILKFWMHLDKKAQRQQLRALERNPLTRWRVSAVQWEHWRMYDRFVSVTERLIQRTSTRDAPWIIVDGSDERYRSLVVGTRIREVLTARLESGSPAAAPAQGARRRVRRSAPARPRGASGRTLVDRVDREQSLLDSLDTSRALSKAAYRIALERQQGRLNLLQRRAEVEGRSLVLVFEGWDAAGKGGAIRRVTAALDPRVYRVVAVAAPNDEERSRHYLWRFWRRLSRAGRVMIFDRSWYGRVLVERVEQFATEAEWARAYAEINEFEEQLTDHGIVIVKYWMHITSDEQERRFKERASTPVKSWKLSDEDWRNRAKWGQYELAVNDMVSRTSTRNAPWHLVEANDKNYARVKVLRIANATLKKALG